MPDDRRQLAALLVRLQAMLGSSDDPFAKARLRGMMQDVERRLVALDAPEAAPTAPITAATRPIPR